MIRASGVGGNLASLEPFEQSGGAGSQRRARLGRSWLHDRHLSENNRGLWLLLNTIAIIPCLTRCIRTQALGESAFVRGVLAFVGGYPAGEGVIPRGVERF